MHKSLPVVVFLLLCHAAASFALEAPLEFVKESDDQGTYFSTGPIDGWFSAAPPAGNWKLPRFKSERPLYAVLNLGDRPHLMVLDVVKKGVGSSSTVLVDCNGNGDLTDDRRVTGPSVGWSGMLTGSGRRFLTAPLDMTVTEKGVTRPYCLRIGLLGRPGGRKSSGPAFRWFSQCHLRASIPLGKTYTILLNDYNRNARFGDRADFSLPKKPSGSSRPVSPGDYFCLFDNEAIDRSEQLLFGELLVLENKTFRMNVDIGARKLVLTEAGKGLAPLKLAMIPDRLTLFSVNDNRYVTVCNPAGLTIMLPPGGYRLVSYRVSRKDDNGDIWRISAATGEYSPVAVAKGMSAALVFGEPYVAKADISVSGRALFGGRNVLMNFRIEGRGKEKITGVTSFKSPALGRSTAAHPVIGRPVAPSFTVVKSDGELAAKGVFRYG